MIGHRADSSADISGVGATTTVSLPTGTQSTDIVAAVFCSTRLALINPNVVSPPAGWTRIGSELTANNGISELTLSLFWAQGNVGALGFSNSQTLTLNQGYVLSAFSGVDLSTPIDVTGTSTNSTGGGAIVNASINIATNNAWHLVGAIDLDANSLTTPAGFTQAANGTPPTNAGAGMFYNTTPKSIGATGTVTIGISVSDSNDILAGLAFALRPLVSTRNLSQVIMF